MIGGELSIEAGGKLAEQLRGAVRTIRNWKAETEGTKDGSVSQAPGEMGSRQKLVVSR
jgi:hypothetical protein